jgi:shikimate kinase
MTSSTAAHRTIPNRLDTAGASEVPVQRRRTASNATINAAVDEVYSYLSGKAVSASEASDMYFTDPVVHRCYALLGHWVDVKYTLYAIPGGSQVTAEVDVRPSRRAHSAARHVDRAANRQVGFELAHLRSALE